MEEGYRDRDGVCVCVQCSRKQRVTSLSWLALQIHNVHAWKRKQFMVMHSS